MEGLSEVNQVSSKCNRKCPTGYRTWDITHTLRNGHPEEKTTGSKDCRDTATSREVPASLRKLEKVRNRSPFGVSEEARPCGSLLLTH